MNSVNFTVGDKEYALRLTTKGVIALEDKLGRNPLEILIDVEAGKMPKLRDVITVLHVALQPLNHNITLEKAADIFDEYVSENEKTMFDFIQDIFVKLMQQGGLLNKKLTEDVNEEEESKN